MKLSVIVPAYNESRTILEILSRVAEVSIVNEIIVVDDGSTDDTFDKVNKFVSSLFYSRQLEKKDSTFSTLSLSKTGRESRVREDLIIKCIKHEKNRGKGAAIRTGLQSVTGDVVTIQDGDMEYDPSDYEKMMIEIEKGAGVVYGSRILGSNKFSYARYYWGGRLLSFLANLLYGLNITDEPTCYKMAKMDIMKRLDLKCERFEFCPEMTAKVARLGEKIIEIPISYNPRSIEEGKKIRWVDGIEAVWTLIRYRFWRQKYGEYCDIRQ